MSGNKIVRATYYFEDIFKVPSNVDLENKEQVEDWWVRHNTLYIKLKNGNVLDIVSQGYEICMKTPNDEEILDAEDTGFKDDEFEEADLGEADSDDGTFLGEKDTEEVVLKECKVTPEPASNEKFEQMWKAMGLPVASDETSEDEVIICPHCKRNEEECEKNTESVKNPITEWCGWGLSCDDCYYKNHPETDELLETKCGCDIIINSRAHDECRCDDDGENWICGDCYNGEYDEASDDETTHCNICLEPSTDKFDMKCDTCKEGYICSDCQNNIVPNGILWADADDVKSAIKCPCCRILNWKSYYSQFIEYGLNYDLEEYEPEEYNNAVQVYLRNKNL